MPSHNSATPVLRLVAERKLSDLLPTEVEATKLEASGVLARQNKLYVVFDNHTQVAQIDVRLHGRPGGVWLGAQSDRLGFEDIAYNETEGRFYLLIEATGVRGSYCSAVVECDGWFHQIRRRPLEFAFDSENKGFEGLSSIQHGNGNYLLALCEGNKCKAGRAGRKPGNGRIQMFRKGRDAWRHVETIKLPRTITFEDYSALDVMDRRVVVVSQASSKIWIGSFAPDSWDFLDDGTIYSFPTDGAGRVLYCNAEGIAWLSPHRVAVVSDGAKAGDQRKGCREKDQSIHIFDLRSIIPKRRVS